MNPEQVDRKIDEILRRLDNLERMSRPIISKESWTPTLAGGTTAGVTTYSLQQGFWVRLESVYLVTGTITWTAATGTGNAQVSLPFTPTYRGSGALWTQNVTFANSTPTIQIASQPFFLMYSPLTNAAGAIVQMEAAGDIRFTCLLFV